MKNKINSILQEIENLKAKNSEEIENLRLKYLSKKGEITSLFNDFKNVPNEQKREIGQLLNELKNKAQEKINALKSEIGGSQSIRERLDLTRTSDAIELGTRHPLSLVKNEIVDIFSRLGFVIAEGPEVEDDWHVFSALNFAPNHPARDMQDTFFVEQNPDIVLRSHTSSVQTRVMMDNQPPIRIICPGRVYRNEAISYRAHCFFHQVEALYIDKNVSFADLRQVLLYFAKEMFGEDTEIRLRPSYFPFTEPSAEMDISCKICGGKGCPFCKGTGWVEILGCGMVDPNVLDNCGIDSKTYSGYALGMGVERITNLKYRVKDLRMFSENDIRFLREFEAGSI
ncbi:MAG: phenylalanine--tRNA ligase subunit alpha [Bacteroidales bacterium]|nr:phenylalanine--tRNA ligase subunit alpha [Bacteroidales bacterium]MBR6309692.1 phenylalanine--tRNA ligase subunit alpha [Paludibacteraceae bacterium]MDD6358187.1 phenylalanine--tRNA ligase subunit alpha [Bacteroidales bacterium]